MYAPVGELEDCSEDEADVENSAEAEEAYIAEQKEKLEQEKKAIMGDSSLIAEV